MVQAPLKFNTSDAPKDSELHNVIEQNPRIKQTYECLVP